MRLNYGQSHSTGYNGYSWSRVSQSITHAYSLEMNYAAVYLSYGNNRGLGFSLRCLYNGNEIMFSSSFHLPLAFVRSGLVDLNLGQSLYVGHAGYGRSRISQSPTYAYFLFMTPTDVYPSGNVGRWLGFSLRYFSPSSYYP